MARGYEVNGLRVARARLALADKPSQAVFAERVGIHWVTQSKIETGKAKVSLDLLERIAAETGESREHFLASADEDDEEAASMTADLMRALDRWADRKFARGTT